MRHYIVSFYFLAYARFVSHLSHFGLKKATRPLQISILDKSPKKPYNALYLWVPDPCSPHKAHELE